MSEANSAKPKPATYDRLASHYDKATAPYERWFLTRWREEALAALPEDTRVLEVGAGTGLNFPFYPKDARVVASELSCEMLKIARGKLRPAGVEIVQTDVEMLPFDDATFDAAFATLVFCSVSAPQKAFGELKRVVRPQGHIILLEHVRPRGLLGFVFDAINPLTVALCEDHFNRRTAEEARRAGLKIVELKARALGIFNLIVCER